MGTKLIDQYTLLHFAVGITFYFWGFSFIRFLIIHTAFELLENTTIGIIFLNSISNSVRPYGLKWPGDKRYSDSKQNIIGDTIGGVVGWYVAYLVDEYGKKKKLLRQPHEINMKAGGVRKLY